MRQIPLSKGKMFALVSDEDHEYLSHFTWSASLESRGTKWYAIRWVTINGKQTKIRMHRVVHERTHGLIPEGLVIDHIDHDSLNNQRENLEAITQRENMRRSPGWRRRGDPISQIDF
jgi:hypothetical protein